MQVTVYSTSTCPFCHQLKSFLDEQEVAYTNFDVSNDTQMAQEMIQKSGQMGVPVIDVDGEIVVGFDKNKISELLKLT